MTKTRIDKVRWDHVFHLRGLLFTLVGTALAVVALKGFMIPNHFLDGGITGISILLHEIFHFPIALILLILNAPFIYIAFRLVGKTFAIQTLLAVVILCVTIHFIEIPKVTDNKILTALFGGLLIGAGMGFVIRGGGVFDGLEVIVHHTQKRLGLTAAEMVFFINSTLFLIAAVFLGIETAMFSILTYFTAVKTTEYVVDGFEEFIALNIIAEESEQVKKIIVNDFNKALTVYKGERGFLPTSFHVSHDCDIIVTIVSRLELYRLQEAIKAADPKAFLYVQSIKEVRGGIGKHTAKH
jgi:uncharacterized membrane-anchored protein YitT (DUF2179 family)